MEFECGHKCWQLFRWTAERREGRKEGRTEIEEGERHLRALWYETFPLRIPLRIGNSSLIVCTRLMELIMYPMYLLPTDNSLLHSLILRTLSEFLSLAHNLYSSFSTLIQLLTTCQLQIRE